MIEKVVVSGEKEESLMVWIEDTEMWMVVLEKLRR